MGLQGKKTSEWFQRGRKSLVSGVSSMFRYWGEEDTLVVDHGEGAYVFDMDGKRYIDYTLGFGPVILGHGEPSVAKAVSEAAAAGTTFAMTQRREIEAAEAVKASVPWVEYLRFTNTGTEATMHAVRLARAYTGRDVILKFEGQYHGVHDTLMFSTAGAPPASLGSRYSPVLFATSSGIPDVVRSTVKALPFNDLELAQRLFRRMGHQIAAVIVEPMLGNAFSIMPVPGFHEGLRALCDEYESIFIFDEVKTGFRIGLGGAQAHFGVTPDLATYAKAMGNGFPVAAIAGRGEVIQAWGKGGIGQAGTYTANAVAMAAVTATIARLKTGEPYKVIEKAGKTLMEGFGRMLAAAGVPSHIVGLPAMFGVFLGEKAPREFRDAAHHDAEFYEKLTRGMIRRGVLPVDDALEPWFLCAALSDEDVATTLSVFEDALKEAKH
jgi:glutamate-1-semialdehyde 2,1-aminomutase